MELSFQDRLQTELKKVNNFAIMKHGDIFVSLRKICNDIKKIKKYLEKLSQAAQANGDDNPIDTNTVQIPNLDDSSDDDKPLTQRSSKKAKEDSDDDDKPLAKKSGKKKAGDTSSDDEDDVPLSKRQKA